MTQDIDRLLHDAEHAWVGYGFAKRMNDVKTAALLLRKTRRLWNQAKRLDPQMSHPAWTLSKMETEPQ